VKEDKRGRACSMHGRVRSVYKTFAGIPEGKRLLRRPRCRSENNIRMDLRELWWEVVEWMHVAQERDQQWTLVDMVIHFQIP
jgi:hypothetical protein